MNLLALAESIRSKRGSRQRIVAHLGELAASERSGWAQLGRNLSKKQRPQLSLFDPPRYDDPSSVSTRAVSLSCRQASCFAPRGTGVRCSVKVNWQTKFLSAASR